MTKSPDFNYVFAIMSIRMISKNKKISDNGNLHLNTFI